MIEGSGHASSCIPIDVVLKSVWVYEMHGDVFFSEGASLGASFPLACGVLMKGVGVMRFERDSHMLV